MGAKIGLGPRFANMVAKCTLVWRRQLIGCSLWGNYKCEVWLNLVLLIVRINGPSFFNFLRVVGIIVGGRNQGFVLRLASDWGYFST